MKEKGEGLKITAKGSKDLPGGRRLHVIVAIAHGNSASSQLGNEIKDIILFIVTQF